MKPPLSQVLSALAKDDLHKIYVYTIEKWGTKQALVYMHKIHKTLEFVRNNPQIGYIHLNLGKEHRIAKIERHLIVYRIKEKTIFVSRILHENQYIKTHLKLYE